LGKRHHRYRGPSCFQGKGANSGRSFCTILGTILHVGSTRFCMMKQPFRTTCMTGNQLDAGGRRKATLERTEISPGFPRLPSNGNIPPYARPFLALSCPGTTLRPRVEHEQWISSFSVPTGKPSDSSKMLRTESLDRVRICQNGCRIFADYSTSAPMLFPILSSC
jgi:hypothetical protein